MGRVSVRVAVEAHFFDREIVIDGGASVEKLLSRLCIAGMPFGSYYSTSAYLPLGHGITRRAKHVFFLQGFGFG